MLQFKRDSEVDTLKKLESFDWKKKITVTVTIDDGENAHQRTTTNNTSSIVNATSYSQDNSRQRNAQSSSENNSLRFLITKIGQPYNHIHNMKISPKQQNKDLRESFDIISHNLIIICSKSETVTQPASNFKENIELKKNIFTLLKSMVCNIMLPQVGKPNFVKKFIHNTMNIGLSAYNYQVSYHRLETLFWEMIQFANQQLIHNETERNQRNSPPNLDEPEKITVSNFFSETTTNVWNTNTSSAKRRKTSQEAIRMVNESGDSPVHSDQHAKNLLRSPSSFVEGVNENNYSSGSDQNNNQLQATMSRGPPPQYTKGLNEVAMSPVSLDGDNNTRQLDLNVPVLNPSISFVTSLNPDRKSVSDGVCRICNNVTNRICLGCSKINKFTYYCSQTCQEIEWSTHMYHCSKPT